MLRHILRSPQLSRVWVSGGQIRSAGHSKWKTIKSKKDIADRKRMIIFTRLASEIATASRLCKGDLTDSNLVSVISRGKEAGMPKESISYAVERGKSGALRGSDYEELLYEGYGPGSVAVIVQAMTDKRARTAQLIKNVFTKNFCETASVFWMFDKKGIFQLVPNIDLISSSVAKNKLLELLIDDDIDDIDDGDDDDGSIIVTVKPQVFSTVADKLKLINPAEISLQSSEMEFIANTTTQVSDEDRFRFEQFEEEMYLVDEVVNMYHNID